MASWQGPARFIPIGIYTAPAAQYTNRGESYQQELPQAKAPEQQWHIAVGKDRDFFFSSLFMSFLFDLLSSLSPFLVFSLDTPFPLYEHRFVCSGVRDKFVDRGGANKGNGMDRKKCTWHSITARIV